MWLAGATRAESTRGCAASGRHRDDRSRPGDLPHDGDGCSCVLGNHLILILILILIITTSSPHPHHLTPTQSLPNPHLILALSQVATLSNIGVLKGFVNFCLLMSLALALNYMLQVTMFTAVIAMDLNRKLEKSQAAAAEGEIALEAGSPSKAVSLSWHHSSLALRLSVVCSAVCCCLWSDCSVTLCLSLAGAVTGAVICWLSVAICDSLCL